MATFYITTSIPYVNADPHIGFALEAVQADALARHRRSRGDQVRFLSGTDDNSLTNVQAAERAGRPVAEFVDARAEAFQALREPLDLSWDDFIRTSRDPRHLPGVERLWQAVADSGDLYRKHYEGRYCVPCEAYYQAEELTGGLCPVHGTEPRLVSEENWFFRLSRYEDALADLYASGRIRIEPRVRANEVAAFIDGGLRDFSVSRSVERARGWGVPVPGDPGQVTYVWFDALGNYVTALDYADGPGAPAFRRWWSGGDRRVHVIGKDILRFHAVYWPAFLLSAGLPLPREIFVHDFLTVEGRKISKSLGNVIDPVALAGEYGTDALRWWLLSQVPKVGDTDFTRESLVRTANRDLAGGIGNLAHRVAGMLRRYRPALPADVTFSGRQTPSVTPPVTFEAGPEPSGRPHRSGGTPAPDVGEGSARLRQAVAELPDRVDAALSAFDFRAAAAAITGIVAEGNRYAEASAPWSLARAERRGDQAAARQLDVVLQLLIATVRTVGAELAPFVPSLSARLSGPFYERTDPAFPRLDPPAGERERR